ncbi:MAG: ABC transporter substrate-binding protein [Myxococcaceae bacterium]|nr:ABC transporter substrate-binding protein [Myxococcaceae bacterium]
MIRTLSTLSTLALVLSLPALAGPREEVSKPLKVIVNSVRYAKDLDALKRFAVEEQGKVLLGDDWAKGTDAQRKEFGDLFLQLFGKLAFPKIRKNFENLDTVIYDEPTVTGDRASIGSTILINHPMKKQELKVKYQVIKDGNSYKVIDVAVLGDSMLTGIRDDQVRPLFKEGGWDGLLKAMRDRNAELKDVVLK